MRIKFGLLKISSLNINIMDDLNGQIVQWVAQYQYEENENYL